MSKRCKPLYCVCGCTIPQRVVIVLLCAMGLFLLWAQRKSIGFLIYEVGALQWSDRSINIIIFLFHLGYVLGLWLGALADKYGGKWFCFIGMTIATVLFSFVPLINEYTPWYVLSFDLLILSIAQGCYTPAMAVIIARWIPFSERATLGGFAFAVIPVSTGLGRLSYKFSEDPDLDFPEVFYYWSGVSIFWCILFVSFVYNNPDKHRYITDEEKTFLDKNIPPHIHTEFRASILMDVVILSLLLGQVGHTISVYVITDSMRLYFEKIGWSTEDLTKIMLPGLIVLWISAIVSGITIDYQIRKKKWDMCMTRKLAYCISFSVSSVFLLSASYVTHKISLYLAYIVALAFKGLHYASFAINYMDITVNYIGLVVTLMEFVGYFSYLLARSLNSIVSIEDWDIMAWAALVFAFLFMPAYYFVASTDRASWDRRGDIEALELEEAMKKFINEASTSALKTLKNR